jgi:hypothetical protein
MVAFRKLFPVFAGLALSSISAFAQLSQAPVSCQANSGVPPVVRAEGYTELTGDIVITCTGGSPTAAAFPVNIQVFLNTQITSDLLSDGVTSDALLMIDEPGIVRSAGSPTPFCVSPATASNSAGLPGYGAAPACNPVAAGNTYQQTYYNVFRGVRPQVTNENALVWQGVPFQAPGTTQTRVIRITNIRANATTYPALVNGLPSQLIAYISVTPQGTLPIENPQQVVGYTQQGLVFDTRNCTNSGGRGSGITSVFQCRSINADRFNSPTATGTLPSNSGSTDTIVGLRFREGFQTAFKTRIIAGQEASLPGQVFNSESGFVNAATGTAGIADAGTRLAARFSNVPSNVRLFVSTTQSSVGTGTAAAILVNTDANGATQPNASPTGAGFVGLPITGPISLACASGATSGVEIPVSGGNALAVWEVTAADPTNNEALVFHVGVAYVANANAGQPGLGTAQVTGNFAPWYTTSNAGLATSGLNVPRFSPANAAAQSLFTINICQTNLLFPFVTNQAGFDTGIAIANTSQDPFSTGNLNAGRITMNYYGSLPNNAPLTVTNERTDRDVPAGSTLTMVLSSGGGYGLKGNPNMQGYIIAQCDFLFAHGFAFITDGPIGQAKVAEGYLAIVLDGPDSSGRVRGNTLGESRGH